VTETIAELYTRQGFFDRAIGVYRELIRRRGDDARLRDRLTRVERLAAGATDEGAWSAELPGQVPEGPVAAGTARPRSEGEARADTPVGAVGQALGRGPDQAEPDHFADSFADGFPAMSSAESAAPGSAAETAGQSTELPPAAPPVTIREYLRQVLAWQPTAAAVEPASAAFDSEAAEPPPDWLSPPSPSESPTTAATSDLSEPSELFDELPGPVPAAHDQQAPSPWAFEAPAVDLEPPAADQVTSAAAHDEDIPDEIATAETSDAGIAPRPLDDEFQAVGFSDADDELFPWELPADVEEDISTPLPSMESEEHPGSKTPFSVDRSEAELPPTVDKAIESTTSSSLSTGPEPAPEAAAPDSGTAEGEEDDLESFQAWLRSLKR
jgi:hypothetical protein